MVRVDGPAMTSAVLFLTLSAARPAAGARVLAIETVAGRSHWNFMRSVLRALTDNGHAVTVFTPFPDGGRDNYTEVDTSGDLPKKHGMDLNAMLTLMGSPATLMPAAPAMARAYCDIVYANGRLTEMLLAGGGSSPTAGFDAILVEPLWTDCMSYLSVGFHSPLIYVIPNPSVTFLERGHVGHVPNPASVSNFFARHRVPVTFVQRFTNVVLLAYGSLAFSLVERWLEYAEPKRYDRVSGSVPPSAIFMNTHHITEPPRPTMSHVIPVGGIHLAPAQDVPQDILEFIENSPHGVIYFTFGSVINMSTLSEHILKAFKDALAQVPQRVLWKYEGEMKDKPKNVMTSKWFPQRDILMHPNVKLFISHGGISSVYEAVDAGVPVLGFPLFYDQPRNIENLVDAGMAISMDLFTVEKDSFLKNVVELTNNPKYKENAKIASDRFKDRPMSPAQLVVYWTEYVIRHKGAPHLQSHALNLTWYQYLLLDVFAVLLIAIFLTFFVAYNCVRFVYKYVLTAFRNIKTKSE